MYTRAHVRVSEAFDWPDVTAFEMHVQVHVLMASRALAHIFASVVCRVYALEYMAEDADGALQALPPPLPSSSYANRHKRTHTHILSHKRSRRRRRRGTTSRMLAFLA